MLDEASVSSWGGFYCSCTMMSAVIKTMPWFERATVTAKLYFVELRVQIVHVQSSSTTHYHEALASPTRSRGCTTLRKYGVLTCRA